VRIWKKKLTECNRKLHKKGSQDLCF